MKRSALIRVVEWLRRKSSTPWACFETNGLSRQGLGVGMYWNNSFINSLRQGGIEGETDEQVMEMFFMFMASRISESVVARDAEEDVVNPEGTPKLTSEANTLRR